MELYLSDPRFRVYPIKLMGDISDAGYFLSVWHILSAGPTHNYYLSLKSQHYKLETGYNDKKYDLEVVEQARNPMELFRIILVHRNQYSRVCFGSYYVDLFALFAGLIEAIRILFKSHFIDVIR